MGYFTEYRINRIRYYVLILIIYLIFALIYFNILRYFSLDYTNVDLLLVVANPVNIYSSYWFEMN